MEENNVEQVHTADRFAPADVLVGLEQFEK
jgi:hypothetical protein